jgi:galactose mutarotase-like enzyme
MSAQFRAEIFNLCNHPIFPLDPDINPASTTFGKILRPNGQTNVPRQIELALRFTF